jgi:hypothetical protein
MRPRSRLKRQKGTKNAVRWVPDRPARYRRCHSGAAGVRGLSEECAAFGMNDPDSLQMIPSAPAPAGPRPGALSLECCVDFLKVLGARRSFGYLASAFSAIGAIRQRWRWHEVMFSKRRSRQAFLQVPAALGCDTIRDASSSMFCAAMASLGERSKPSLSQAPQGYPPMR